MTDRSISPRLRPGLAAWVCVAVAAIALALTIAGWQAGGWAIDIPWAPTLGVRIELRFDGLAALYALLATGIGLLVFAYSTGYLPRHLEHQGRTSADAPRFWGWMLLFMGSMVGLAASQDLVLMFLFFDLTAVASYFLIGFDRQQQEARGAALLALVVTTGSAVAMLVGAVLLGAQYGTFSLPAILAAATAGPMTSVAAALIAVAALAKSAQMPLHFWLPRAMAAPTPVSAYLHSAAMVAAGVLVLGRVHPLLALDQRLLDGLLVVGFVSIFTAGALALAQDELKQVLAYSTISQYGYVVVLYGLGGPAGAAGAALYVIAHGIAKSALFLTAGYVTEATGESRLSRLGGLWRDMPAVALAAGVAAASLAAIPLTMGFFSDELFFAAAVTSQPVVQALAVGAAALTFSYIARFWFAVFAGERQRKAGAVPRSLAIPIIVLAALAVAGGVLVQPFAALAASAASVIHAGPVDVSPGYHLELRAETLMAVSAWAIGILLLVAPGAPNAAAHAVARAGEWAGPRRLYGAGLLAIDRLSERVHQSEVRDLRTSLAAILVPTGILVGVGFVATPTTAASYVAGPLVLGDAPLVVLLVVAVAAAVTAARDTGRLRPVLALSVLGFALAGIYAIVGAPDVALVAIVIETVLSIVFVAVFAQLPATAVQERGKPAGRGFLPSRRASAGVVAGVSAFAVIWAALSRPPIGTPDATSQIALTPAAHGGDVVTVILADFRGLDTMVEITVLMVAILGAASLLRRERPQ